MDTPKIHLVTNLVSLLTNRRLTAFHWICAEEILHVDSHESNLFALKDVALNRLCTAVRQSRLLLTLQRILVYSAL